MSVVFYVMGILRAWMKSYHLTRTYHCFITIEPNSYMAFNHKDHFFSMAVKMRAR